jgi:Protein of unknown function (DUF3618)
MDATQEGTTESVGVSEIRQEIELVRLRIVETIDALEYKADVPSRLTDVLSATASKIAADLVDRVPASIRPQQATSGGSAAPDRE